MDPLLHPFRNVAGERGDAIDITRANLIDEGIDQIRDVPMSLCEAIHIRLPRQKRLYPPSRQHRSFDAETGVYGFDFVVQQLFKMRGRARWTRQGNADGLDAIVGAEEHE